MTVRPIVPRRSARKDVEIAVDYYAREAGAQIALSFIDALESTYTLLAEHPASGSLRYAYELGLPGLRRQGAKRVSVYGLLSRASRSRRRMACPGREARYTGLAARPGSTQRVTAPRGRPSAEGLRKPTMISTEISARAIAS